MTMMSNAVAQISINGVPLQTLADIGASGSYITQDFVQKYPWKIEPSQRCITMPSIPLTIVICRHCYVTIIHKGTTHECITLFVMVKLGTDVLLGRDFTRQHKRVTNPRPSSVVLLQYKWCPSIYMNIWHPTDGP